MDKINTTTLCAWYASLQFYITGKILVIPTGEKSNSLANSLIGPYGQEIKLDKKLSIPCIGI